jgi:phosphoribosylformylglycinamidine (FGAM) synthase-like enzyme
MAIGGSIGAEIDLSAIDESLRSDVKLFSESPTRWIIEIPPGKELKAVDGVDVVKIGTVGGDSVMIYEDEEILFDQSVEEIEAKWARRLWEIMG